ncbi:MIP/aquaporin family protein [Catenuloplanes indicus]|uniref:Aquaporin Z n=1 Tax=Catenuloplanes indicus TaxID=137267 RepID=A0AAE3VWC4_9ACTN|nr:aquaporin [Catenuloplanes indicus]MDQ0365213.1 aquaporin Z [Catenuloplanes indicus]
MRKFAAEFVGTFFLMMTVSIAVSGMSDLAPLAIGGVLTVMIYAAGHISGAHFNPAVTLAALVRGAITRTDAAGYVVAQAAAGLLAALTARWMARPADLTALSFTGRAIAVAALAEFLFTFALAYVVLNVATSRDHPDNSFYGLAIGGTVMAGAVTIGGISGAVLNPAVAVGGAVFGLFTWSAVGIYLVATLLGGAAAGAVFLALNPADRPGVTPVEPAAAAPAHL